MSNIRKLWYLHKVMKQQWLKTPKLEGAFQWICVFAVISYLLFIQFLSKVREEL